MSKSSTHFDPGDEILIPWGLDHVRGTVREIYGPPSRRHVVVVLSPSTSDVVDEETTVSVPYEAVVPLKAS